jgi:hypothetical protein
MEGKANRYNRSVSAYESRARLSRAFAPQKTVGGISGGRFVSAKDDTKSRRELFDERK